jgi:aspartyl protease family protein
MGKTALMALFAIAILIGWFAPDPGPAVSHQAANVPPANAKEHFQNVSDTMFGETVLERHGDGHFYADVDVNDEEIRFMVDTGASGIALTGSDAEMLGLGWTDGELGVVGRGAGGNVYGKRVRLASVSLGDIAVTDVEAVIIPRGLDVSLLGQSFLSKAESVRIEDGEMVIS